MLLLTTNWFNPLINLAACQLSDSQPPVRPRAWQWFPVGDPADICQQLPVSSPADAFSCSPVGGPVDTWQCFYIGSQANIWQCSSVGSQANRCRCSSADHFLQSNYYIIQSYLSNPNPALVSRHRSQQKSHCKMVIPNICQCQNFHPGYLCSQDHDNGHL